MSDIDTFRVIWAEFSAVCLEWEKETFGTKKEVDLACKLSQISKRLKEIEKQVPIVNKANDKY